MNGVKDSFDGALFAGRTALVTGGTSGIGAGIALALADHGAMVHAIGLAAAQEELPRHERVSIHEIDVTDEQAITTVLDGIDRLAVLVNCAGIAREDGSEHESEGWDRVIAVNLTATMRISTLARPLLARDGHASIINIASMYSTFGSDLVPAYAASKGGIVQLTRSLAQAYVDDGIRVNAIAPGWIDTPLGRGRMNDAQANAAIMARTPMRRWGKPHDVAQAALFLCSDAAGYITGVTLPVDGGYLTV